MQDVVVGVLVMLVGVFFCFRGYLAMRVMIPIWGALVGFVFGASLVASFADQTFLGTLAGWLVGFAVALVFGGVAFLFYEISVLIAMTSIGFTLGTTAMVALDITGSWAVILVGVAVATVLAFLAIVADLPTGILVALTSLAGASAIVLGLMLIVGAAESADFSTTALNESIDDAWWWWVLYVVLAVAGAVSQARVVERLRSSMRAEWTDAGGRQIRRT